MRIIRIAFVGPSGVGKSTCYRLAKSILEEAGFVVFRCDVAYPLRCIQSYAYETFGLANPGDPDDPADFRQDGALLGFLARHFEGRLGLVAAERVRYLCTRYREQIAIINTDCRNNAYPALKQLEFIFVRLEVDPEVLKTRRAAREDLLPFDHAAAVEQTNLIEPAYAVENNGTLEDLQREVRRVVSEILNR